MSVDDSLAERDQLAQEIAAVFAGRAYPGEEALASPSSDPGNESTQVACFFRGKRWQEVSADSILSSGTLDRGAFIYFLSPEAFAYFLPAFLTISLNSMDAPELAESVHFSLATPDSEQQRTPMVDWQAERLALLTEQEQSVVAKAWRYIDKQMETM